MSLPRITPRDDPLPPVRALIRIEQDPYQFDETDVVPLLRRVHGDGSRELLFGDERIQAIRRDDSLSTSNNYPYVVFTLDDGEELDYGKVSISEYHWLRASIRGPQQ